MRTQVVPGFRLESLYQAQHADHRQAEHGKGIAHADIDTPVFQAGHGVDASGAFEQARGVFNPSTGLNKPADPCVCRADQAAAGFDSPENILHQVLVGGAGAAVPGVVGQVDQQGRRHY